MLEGQSCVISRGLPSSREQESKWVYMTYHFIEVANGKRRLEEGAEEEFEKRKSSKQMGVREREETIHTLLDLSLSPVEQFDQDGNGGDQSDSSSLLQSLGPVDQTDQEGNGGDQLDLNSPLQSFGEKSGQVSDSSSVIQSLSRVEQYDQEANVGDGSDSSSLIQSLGPVEQSDQEGNDGDQFDSSSLIQSLGRDISINCFIRCSRSDYNSLASLNRDFRSLIRNGELYRLRRRMSIIEHWVYFSCHVLEWEAFDPIRRRWMHLPRMPSNECFMCSDKESLAVGTELLVFGKEITAHVIWKYSILNNSWSSGMTMNFPRCLFGSASLGEIAILAGGCDSQGRVLSSAELYNSETGTWLTLPSMNKPRKMCSGVFMDGKFYVIGGSNSELLSCGEEYNLETRTWREIPNMFPGRNGPTEAPPLVGVVNNELYAADYAEKEVRKYDKERNLWITVGRLPERAVSMNGWGLAFRACGDRLIVIGGPRALAGGIIELNSWIPREGPPQWELLARKRSGSFVYNCAVMGC